VLFLSTVLWQITKVHNFRCFGYKCHSQITMYVSYNGHYSNLYNDMNNIYFTCELYESADILCFANVACVASSSFVTLVNSVLLAITAAFNSSSCLISTIISNSFSHMSYPQWLPANCLATNIHCLILDKMVIFVNKQQFVLCCTRAERLISLSMYCFYLIAN